MRVIVCGSRDYTNRAEIRLALASVVRSVLAGGRAVTVVTGGCRGADQLGAASATALGLAVETFEANWDRDGRSGGPLRNQRMIDAGADLVLAFGEGRGTADLVRRATRARIPVTEIP